MEVGNFHILLDENQMSFSFWTQVEANHSSKSLFSDLLVKAVMPFQKREWFAKPKNKVEETLISRSAHGTGKINLKIQV